MSMKAGKWDMTSLLLLLLVFIAVLGVYAPVLSALPFVWETNDDYSHGYYIPFVSLLMIYSLRKRLQKTPVLPANSGLFLLVAGLGIYVVAKVSSTYFLERTSLIAVLLGLVQFLLGGRYLSLLAYPILYLIFMIPLPAILWNKIAFPMQLFASYLTEQVIYVIGIPIFREGNVLHLAETTLEVVEACSGLRSLVTMLGLASALVFFVNLSRPKKIILFLSALPIAVLANIVRLSVTAVLASRYGSEVAHGFLHGFSGVLVFLLGIALLLVINSLLSR